MLVKEFWGEFFGDFAIQTLYEVSIRRGGRFGGKKLWIVERQVKGCESHKVMNVPKIFFNLYGLKV